MLITISLEQCMIVGHDNNIPTMQLSLEFPEIVKVLYAIIDRVFLGIPK